MTSDNKSKPAADSDNSKLPTYVLAAADVCLHILTFCTRYPFFVAAQLTTLLVLLSASAPTYPHHHSTGDFTKVLRQLLQAGIINVIRQVLDVHVSELGVHAVATIHALQEWTHKHQPVLKHHAVDLLNSKVSSLLRLKVDEAVTLGLTLTIRGHLAGQDVAKLTEGIMECLVVNGLVKVLQTTGQGSAVRHMPHAVLFSAPTPQAMTCMRLRAVAYWATLYPGM